jgi:hypothetical protein
MYQRVTLNDGSVANFPEQNGKFRHRALRISYYVFDVIVANREEPS